MNFKYIANNKYNNTHSYLYGNLQFYLCTLSLSCHKFWGWSLFFWKNVEFQDLLIMSLCFFEWLFNFCHSFFDIMIFLTNSMPLVSLYTTWKYQKTPGFLMFSGGIEIPVPWNGLIIFVQIIYNALHGLVPFVQFQKLKNTHGACNFIKGNTPPWVFFTFLCCTNDIKSRRASHIFTFSLKEYEKVRLIKTFLLCIDEEPVGTKYMVTYRKGVIQRKLVLCPRLYFYNTGNYII